MSSLKEYVVTLKNIEDLDQFYEDMETAGGDLYIPNRVVDLAYRRENSRNTHYYLTKEEALLLKSDPRVVDVELTIKDLPVVIRPAYIQTETTWDKTSANTASHKNWGLLRVVNGVQISNWGSDATPLSARTQTGTIQVNAQARNVDVVIVDGMINPAHPEYALNSDGTGGTRVIQYNWFQHRPSVEGSSAGNYVYTPYTGTGAEADNNHGAHVAGTACGNTQGWARSANIYNINPYGSDVNSMNSNFLFDYIRAFHNNKSVNPNTGRRNPTICNNSWGAFYNLGISSITSVRYRGTTTALSNPSEGTLLNYGIYSSGGYAATPLRNSALDADIQDAINDGILFVGAAGNSYAKMDISGGLDYDNYYVWGGNTIYYHRGGSPASAATVICVGAVGSTIAETKATFSHCGPRVDLYAPGANIMSSFNSSASYGGVSDPRNASYIIGKIGGTSMASPQVTGVLACALEIYPNMTQSMAVQYIQAYGKLSQMTDTGGGFTDYTSLQGGANRYLFYYKERKDSGNTWPKVNHFVRPSTGVYWPRAKIRRTS